MHGGGVGGAAPSGLGQELEEQRGENWVLSGERAGSRGGKRLWRGVASVEKHSVLA